MAHRAQQIVDAIASKLAANVNLRAAVYTHRTLSLSEDERELPAITVNVGEDEPESEGAEQLNRITSALEAVIAAACVGDSEKEVIDSLLELRTQSHIALMADTSLGLAFVWQTEYAGASAPQLRQGERMCGTLTMRWRVHYEMNISDPQ